jgi:hypothetical protein
MSGYMCPVCGYQHLKDPPRSSSGGGSYEICPACGFEFGVSDDDLGYTYDEWRQEWVADGMPWRSSRPRPCCWDPDEQVKRIVDG